MANIFRTDTMSKEEVIKLYERITKDYQKETEHNAVLQNKIKYLENERERLEELIKSLLK